MVQHLRKDGRGNLETDLLSGPAVEMNNSNPRPFQKSAERVESSWHHLQIEGFVLQVIRIQEENIQLVS